MLLRRQQSFPPVQVTDPPEVHTDFLQEKQRRLRPEVGCLLRSWFHFLFHSGSFFPLRSAASCPPSLFSIRGAVFSGGVFLLNCSHSLARVRFFRGLAAATALASDPASATGAPASPPSTQSLSVHRPAPAGSAQNLLLPTLARTKPLPRDTCRRSCLTLNSGKKGEGKARMIRPPQTEQCHILPGSLIRTDEICTSRTSIK